MADTQTAHAHPNYMLVFWLLVILTGASFVTYFASGVISDAAIILFVMLVAVCKASLVAMFFMHLKFEGPWKYVVLVPAGLLLALLVIALIPDVGLRGLG
jgi:cytochrome c oxidase subunit 4